MAAAFTCTHYNALPEHIVDGEAAIAVVRRNICCPALLAQTRTRWAIDRGGCSGDGAGPGSGV